MIYDVNLANKPFIKLVWLPPVLVIIWCISVGWLCLNGYHLYATFSGRGMTQKAIVELQQKERNFKKKLEVLKTKLAREDIDQLNEITGSINSLLMRHAFSWSIFLDRLEEVLPYSVRILSLQPNMDDKGSITIQINALTQERDGLLKFIDALNESPYFANPSPASLRDQERGVPEGRLFNLKVQYLPHGQS